MCDICGKVKSFLEQITVDWDHSFKMVCVDCITERGRYMILCRIDRPAHLQDDAYRARAFK